MLETIHDNYGRYPQEHLVPIRKLLDREGYWHMRSERKKASSVISCTTEYEDCVVSRANPECVRPPSVWLGTAFRQGSDMDLVMVRLVYGGV